MSGDLLPVGVTTYTEVGQIIYRCDAMCESYFCLT